MVCIRELYTTTYEIYDVNTKKCSPRLYFLNLILTNFTYYHVKIDQVILFLFIALIHLTLEQFLQLISE